MTCAPNPAVHRTRAATSVKLVSVIERPVPVTSMFGEGGGAVEGRRELVGVLCEARFLLALPGNDFAWSSWADAPAALAELDRRIAAVEAGELPPLLDLAVLFAPTGPMQEVSLSSGWAHEFLAVAARFDAAAERVYGRPT
jgi:hypothetical protein